MTQLHGKDIKVGDKVFSILHGPGEVVGIRPENTYPLAVFFDSTGIYTFDSNGKVLKSNPGICLFWDEMNLVLAPKPWRINEGDYFPMVGLRIQVEVVFRDGCTDTGKSDDFNWVVDGEADDIMKWRLA